MERSRPPSREFFRDARRRGLEGTFRAVGFAADIQGHLEKATVLALPTVHREGMRRTLIEKKLAIQLLPFDIPDFHIASPSARQQEFSVGGEAGAPHESVV